jgi:hypothetical protein
VEIKQHTKAPRKIKASAAPVGETVWRAVMPEPREEDDIALGLDEEEIEDESYDTLEELYED